jgi:uncharacterized protein
MKHLQASFSGKNEFWRYILMILVVLVAANTVGAIPLYVALIINTIRNPEAIRELTRNPNDLSVLGFSQNMGLVVQLIPFLAVLVIFIFIVKPLNQRSIGTVINGNVPFRWNRLLVSAAVWLTMSAIYLIANMKVDPSNFSLNNKSLSLIPLILISLTMIPFQAAFEEILFRGYLMQGFTALAKNAFIPLVSTALLFGLMHGLNPEVKEFGFWTMLPQYVVFGIIFGIITILDDGIEAAIGAHAANNAFLCIMLTNESSALQTPAIFVQHRIYPWTEFGMMVLMGVVILLIMGKIFKWGSLMKIFSKVEKETLIQVP